MINEPCFCSLLTDCAFALATPGCICPWW
jgi:hypothetical protein